MMVATFFNQWVFSKNGNMLYTSRMQKGSGDIVFIPRNVVAGE